MIHALINLYLILLVSFYSRSQSDSQHIPINNDETSVNNDPMLADHASSEISDQHLSIESTEEPPVPQADPIERQAEQLQDNPAIQSLNPTDQPAQQPIINQKPQIQQQPLQKPPTQQKNPQIQPNKPPIQQNKPPIKQQKQPPLHQQPPQTNDPVRQKPQIHSPPVVPSQQKASFHQQKIQKDQPMQHERMAQTNQPVSDPISNDKMYSNEHRHEDSNNQRNPPRSPPILHNDPELDYIMRVPSPQVESDNDGNFFSSSKNFVSMTAIVRPGAKDCYFYEPETHFDVDFQVIKGDKLDVGLIVIDPAGTPVVFRDAVSEGATPIHVLSEFRRKPFAVCLDNRKASHGEKTVYLAIDLRLNWRNPTAEDMDLINSINFRLSKEPGREELRQQIENLERMSKRVDRVATLLHRAQRLQQRSRNRASVDRVLMESNRHHIMAWSTFQLFAMVFVGIVQTLLIRSLFDEKSSFYKLWLRGCSRDQKFVHSNPRY